MLNVIPDLGQSEGFENSYNMALPYAMAYYFPTGMLGVGLTALLASFMSGMAGNVTAFNTLWTYDIYKAYINPDAPDRHCLNMGRIATVAGVALSIVWGLTPKKEVVEHAWYKEPVVLAAIVLSLTLALNTYFS